MKLPALTAVSDEALHAIAERHCPGVQQFTRLPEIGIFNSVFLLGKDLVLRVPRDDPQFRHSLEKEVIAVPAARAAGVHTPPIIAFDDSCDLLPVPFIIYERVHGETLEPLDRDETAEARILWYQLGVALRFAQRGPEPARSWGERPLGMLLQILRFLLESPDKRWRDLRPSSSPLPPLERWEGAGG